MNSFRHTNRNVLFAICMMFALPGSTLAQQVYGSIFGTVTDASGSGVPNATVTISEPSKNVHTEVSTNETGNYTKGQLIPGVYTVEVAGTGFTRSVIRDITVQVDQAARVDVALQIGATSETVEVTATPPALQADRADVQTTFSAKQLI
ncbi:MAG: carboxypeptidase-like regulatory domain-containing protein, partial [Acidobacteriota bacterium]|nr:carboxypeptidase-like regulatory domain-containing protein [Acidobacteriota bacterium]